MLLYWKFLVIRTISFSRIGEKRDTRARNKKSSTAKEWIKWLRTFQSRAQELCYFPGKGFIRSERCGSAKGALCACWARKWQARHRKGSYIGVQNGSMRKVRAWNFEIGNISHCYFSTPGAGSFEFNSFRRNPRTSTDGNFFFLSITRSRFVILAYYSDVYVCM